MKKTVFSVTALMIVAVLIFSSCNSARLIRPVGSLLSPPLYYEEYESLVEAFNNNVDKNVFFSSPRKGEHRSAIIVEDIDSDGQEEALVFYKDSLDSTVARMHYLNFVDDRWISRGDFSGYGNEVEEITITDMDNDGSSELIVIWSISGVSSSSVMSVYRTSHSIDEYKEISNETCSLCEVVDIDGDSKDEILFINQSTVSGISQRTAKVMKLSGNSFVLFGETKVDPNISSYASLKTEKVSEGAPLKVYIDAFKGESQMITELIYWDKEKSELCAPLLDIETMSNSLTLRYEPIASADINNDGIIDIPVQSEILGGGDDYSTTDTEAIYFTKWLNYSGTDVTVVADTLVNYSDGYMIHLDDNEHSTTGIRNYRAQNCWVVYRTDSNGESVGELYSVLRINKERWENEDLSAYIPITEKDGGIVCVYITKSGVKLGVDKEYISTRVAKIPS